MQIISEINLIGDAVNQYGILRDLSIKHDGIELLTANSEWFYELLPKDLNIKFIKSAGMGAQVIDMLKAYDLSRECNLHMSQAYHAQFGLPVPCNPIKPELVFEQLHVPVYDYILAPHSRSLPPKEKWDAEKWIELAQELEEQGNSVCFFGNSLFDKEFIGFNNEYDRPMVEVLNMIKACNEGVISVVTGISHLCYAVGAKNYVMCNQLNKWGLNPDCIHIKKYIPELTVDEVLEVLCAE